jgi:hypothetical protein
MFLDVFHTWLNQDYFQWLHKDGQHVNSRGHDIIFNQLKDMLRILYP